MKKARVKSFDSHGIDPFKFSQNYSVLSAGRKWMILQNKWTAIHAELNDGFRTFFLIDAPSNVVINSNEDILLIHNRKFTASILLCAEPGD